MTPRLLASRRRAERVNPRVSITAAGFGIAFFGALVVWLMVGAPGSSFEGASAGLDRSGYAGAIRPSGIPPQPLTGLVDERGRAARFTDDVAIVTFAYTQCEDACPTTLQQIRIALDDMKDPPPAYVISVDPTLDTPERARAFLADQGVLGRVSFLTGTVAALQQQWRGYGIQPQTSALDHSLSIVLLDRSGRQRIGFPLDKLTPRGLIRDITTLRGEPVPG